MDSKRNEAIVDASRIVNANYNCNLVFKFDLKISKIFHRIIMNGKKEKKIKKKINDYLNGGLNIRRNSLFMP